MRVAVYGAKHDTLMFETLLKEYCVFEQPGLSGNAMIDTACLGTPKVYCSLDAHFFDGIYKQATQKLLLSILQLGHVLLRVPVSAQPSMTP